MIDIEKVDSLGGPIFDKKAATVEANIYRVRGKVNVNRRCMIYFHAYGGYAGSIYTNQAIPMRYAIEADITVINVNYRLAPENKSPAALHDGYAALKWVL